MEFTTYDNSAYKGNKSLKKAYENVEFTEHQVQEFVKCAKDVNYFASNYVKVVHPDKGLIPIKLYDYQQQLLSHFKDNRNCIVLSSRQSGKCLGGGTLLLVKDNETSDPYEITFSELYERLIGDYELYHLL